MRVVSVVGYKGVGKTTLVERLVPALKRDGRVATVKSIHHDVAIDQDATDTARHREAGADSVIGVSPSTTFQVDAVGKDDGVTVYDVIERLAAEDYDFVIIEGFKTEDVPAIQVGEVTDDDVGGPVIASVGARSDPDIGELRQEILALDPWEQRESADY